MKTDNRRHRFINRTNRSKDSNLHTGIGCRVVLNIRKTRVKVLEVAIPHFSNLSILLLTARVQPFQPSFHPDSTHKQSITRLQSFGQLVRADANVFRVCLVHFVREQLPSPFPYNRLGAQVTTHCNENVSYFFSSIPPFLESSIFIL